MRGSPRSGSSHTAFAHEPGADQRPWHHPGVRAPRAMRLSFGALSPGRTVIPKTTIDSWADLAALLPMVEGGRWLFRGESQSGWELRPSAGRVGRHTGAARKIPFDRTHERAILKLFKRQARPYLSHTPSTDCEWLAVAQHHGMHTRLLDWTESLFVAAYFAVIQAGVNGPAVIVGGRDVPEISQREENAPLDLKRVAVVYRPPHIAPRIPAQRSVFTVHADPTKEFRPAGMVRWRVSKDACWKIKRMLDSAAINESTLFPDLDGLARYLGWRYKWGKLDGA